MPQTPVDGIGVNLVVGLISSLACYPRSDERVMGTGHDSPQNC